MKVETNKVVTAHYTLFDEKGERLESSHESEPLTFIQGSGMLIKGFEAAVEGKSDKDSFSFTVKPEDGYGAQRDDLLFELPLERLEEIPDLEVGMALRMETPTGTMVVRVVKIEDGKVALDGNHPLAGQELRFDVEILGVRDATPQELDQLARRSAACESSCGDTCCGGCEGECEG